MARQILLIVLGALLLAAAWRYLLPISGQGKDRDLMALEPARSSGFTVREVYPGNQLVTLEMARLDVARPHSAAGRDPWRFQDPLQRKPLPQAETDSVPPSRQPSVQPQPAATPPELTLEYLGSFGPRDRKIAVLSDGKRTFNVLEGDVLDGRFIVERIGYESVEIRLVGFPDRPAKRLGLRQR